MSKKTQRSTFWVVSTHVLTTGIAMPFVAAIVGSVAIGATQPPPIAAFLIALTFQALGYIGGTFYSLSYIRKVALIKKPTDCIKPSIIAFSVLAIIFFGIDVAILQGSKNQGVNPIAIILQLAFFVIICFVFGKITQTGFSKMEAPTTED